MSRFTNSTCRAARLAIGLGVFWPCAGIGQDATSRAEYGDQVASTAAGADYNEAIAPFAIEAMQACAQQGLQAGAGEITTLVAEVAQDGSWSNVMLEQASATADCLSKRLLADKLPVPAGWDWKQGAFPLTLRVGVGLAEGD